MTISRRKMMMGTAGILGTASMVHAARNANAALVQISNLLSASGKVDGGPVVIATWPFRLDACRESFRVLGIEGRTAMDAVEAGIRITEADVTNRWVGIGVIPTRKVYCNSMRA